MVCKDVSKCTCRKKCQYCRVCEKAHKGRHKCTTSSRRRGREIRKQKAKEKTKSKAVSVVPVSQYEICTVKGWKAFIGKSRAEEKANQQSNLKFELGTFSRRMKAEWASLSDSQKKAFSFTKRKKKQMRPTEAVQFGTLEFKEDKYLNYVGRMDAIAIECYRMGCRIMWISYYDLMGVSSCGPSSLLESQTVKHLIHKLVEQFQFAPQNNFGDVIVSFFVW